MTVMLKSSRSYLTAVALLGVVATACSASATPSALEGPAAIIHDGDCVATADNSITVYSGRSEDLVGPVLEAFTCATGIAIETNFGDPTDLALALSTEGDLTPADVFLSKSPGAVGFLRNEGLLTTLNSDLTEMVDTANAAADQSWVGVTGRQRVLVYNVDNVAADDLPASILDLADPIYRGRVAIPANNGSFLDWFTVFRAQAGDAVATQWLDDMVANDAIVTESNRPTVDAVGRGEFDFGLVNHYYNFQEAAAIGDSHRAENHVFANGDIGSLVLVTAASITSASDDVESAEALIEFMLADGAQTYFTTDTLEYPLASGITPASELPALSESGAQFDVGFDSLGDGLQESVAIIEASGING